MMPELLFAFFAGFGVAMVLIARVDLWKSNMLLEVFNSNARLIRELRDSRMETRALTVTTGPKHRFGSPIRSIDNKG